MSESKLKINANLEITGYALETVVTMAKTLSKKDEKGRIKIDTAGLVSDMITKFLEENDFDGFVSKAENYQGLIQSD